MIVNEQTPKYEYMTVEQGGSLLPEADVLGEDSVGVKITQDRELVKITFDSLATYPGRGRFTPDEAEHLARLLIAHAKAARAW